MEVRKLTPGKTILESSFWLEALAFPDMRQCWCTVTTDFVYKCASYQSLLNQVKYECCFPGHLPKVPLKAY